MYVNYGLLYNQKAAYLIGYVVDHIVRIYYIGYYNHKSGTYTLYPRNVACPGSYDPDLFRKRKISGSDVRRAG